MSQSRLSATFYLVISPKRYNGLGARLVTKKPSLKANEVAMLLNVAVPESLFEKPTLRASVSVPESAVTPSVLDVLVLDNVREIIEAQTGMKVEIAVVDPEVQR